MSPQRLRVVFVPTRSPVGPYRSLERLAETTRTALAARFDLVELDADPAEDPSAFLAAFQRARPIDAVLDLSDHLLHAPFTRDLPTLLFALGNMPNGATLPWMRRSRLKTTDVFLLNCTSDVAIWERVFGGTGPVGALLPLGVDTEAFRPRPHERLPARRDLGVPDDAFVLVYAGRLNVQKNVLSLLLLLRELVPREPRAHLVLAGEFDTIPHALFQVTNEGYEALLRGLVSRWGLDERVTFAGKLGDGDLARLLAAADVFVTLSLHNNENFGYAPVEAMAAGLPVVATHFGGFKDTVVHGETGYHVESLMTDNGLRAAWHQALAPLLALAADPARRAAMGARARERAVREYGLAAYASLLERHVREAVARCRHATGEPGSAFRFSPGAMRLHLRNLHRTIENVEGRKRLRGAEGRIDYATYRWFQGPYATRDVADATLADEDRLLLLTRSHLDRAKRVLVSLDPVWPRTYELAPAEVDAIAALEPGVTLKQILDRGEAGGVGRGALGQLLERLLHEGVVGLDRPFRP